MPAAEWRFWAKAGNTLTSYLRAACSSAIRAFTSLRTRAAGSGLSGGNRIVPFEVSYFFRSVGMRADDGWAHRIETAMICRCAVTDKRTPVEPESGESVAEAFLCAGRRGANCHPDFLQRRTFLIRDRTEVSHRHRPGAGLWTCHRLTTCVSNTPPCELIFNRNWSRHSSRPFRIMRSAKPSNTAPKKCLDNAAGDESQQSQPGFDRYRQHRREGGKHQKSSPMECHDFLIHFPLNFATGPSTPFGNCSPAS